MYKLTFALLVIFVSCKSSPETKTTVSGVQYKIIHSPNGGLIAPMISTVKAVPNTKTDSAHSHLPLYKLVVPPAPYTSDPLSEVLIGGVREGDSLVIIDTKGVQVSYKIEKVFVPGYKGMNADSLIEVDKQKEILLMQKEQFEFGNARIERFIKLNNPRAVKQDDIFVEIQNKGIAPLADSGRKAGIKFSSFEIKTGKLLHSNVDTSFHLPPVYEYVVSTGQMYKPVDKIMNQLGKGGKALVYIPAIVTLGQKANNPTVDLTQDILFELEVVSVK